MARAFPTLSALSGFSRLNAGDLVRAGLPVQVRVLAWTEEACAAALAEVRRHVRSTSAFGIFDFGTRGPELTRATGVDGSAVAVWVGSVHGETWRSSGSEYNAGALARAVEAASVCRCEVFRSASSGSVALTREIVEQSDPRAPGSSAETVSTGGGRVAGAAGSVLDGAAAGAQGVGSFAQGIGGGAQAAGALAAEWPILAFTAAVVLVVLVRRGVL